MEEIMMSWRCLIDTLPFSNAIIMIGEIDESPISMQLVMARALLYMKVAEENLGRYIQVQPECYNYPEAKKGKIVVKFHVLFPDKKQLEKFKKELSLLN